jgi:hypothetical protein
MTENGKSADAWDATWEGARRQHLKSALAATPAQRLAWLEEMIEIAFRAGALKARHAAAATSYPSPRGLPPRR